MPTHAEQRIVPYAPEQIFDLVADVERYPQFLPWCLACRIRRHLGPDQFVADLMIGFKVFREKFSSEVSLRRPDRIDVAYHDGPFRYLNNHWTFRDDGSGHCIINFYIDFEFRSKALQALIGKLFNEAVQRMVNAFERRAGQLYGAVRPVEAVAAPAAPSAKPSGE